MRKLFAETYIMLRLKFFLITQTRVQNAVKHLWFGVFLVHIFPHLNWIRRNTSYLSVLNPNVGKYGPEKLRIRTLFTQWRSFRNTDKFLGIENEPSKICARQPIKKWSDIVCLSRPYHCKFLKGCLPQI